MTDRNKSHDDSTFRFSRERRIRKEPEFARVFSIGITAVDAMLVIRGARRVGMTRGPSRLGLTVGRVVGTAPVRNRWKRLIREAFRLSRDQLPMALDLVVRPRRGAEPDFARVKKSLVVLARRIDRQLQRDETAED